MTDPTTPTVESVYGTRPLVEVDGRRDDLLIGNLVAAEVLEEEGGLSRCELEVSNSREDADNGVGLAFEGDDSVLRFGAQLAVGFGQAMEPVEIFRGRISGLEGRWTASEEPRLAVLAEDALVAGRLLRRSKTYPAGTLADLARTVAGQMQLTPQIDGCDAQIGIQVQYDESDLAFLRRVLGRYDTDLQVVGEDLHITPRSRVRRSELTLAFPDQLQRVRVLADLAHQVTQVTCTGWDADQGRRISVTSGADADRGPGRGMRGPEVLERAFGGRRSEHLGAHACRNADEAQALANAVAATRGRRFVTVEALCAGDPRLRVGSHVTLLGLGGRFSGTSYIVRVRHRFDLMHGYRCDFTAESAFFAGGEQ